MDNNNRHIEFFSDHGSSGLVKIILCAVVFHAAVVGICIGLRYVDFSQEPEPIPVFEMVQVTQPQVKPAAPKQKPPEPKQELPEPPPEKPITKPEPKPKVNKKLPPEPKVEDKKPDPEPEQQVEPDPTPEQPPEPVDDFAVDDLDLPATMEASSLNPVGSVDMDPLMQVYLERLKQIIMGNFNPPGNLQVRKDAKTTVQFTVDRFGGITAITLKRSSGNKTWDHLSVRAVQISKVPELPPNFRAPSLILHFNFTPN